MKEYKKPAMLALSISANDMLCSGCADHQLRDDEMFKGVMLDKKYDFNNNGTFDKDDYAKLFAATDTEPSSCNQVVDYNGYCKFTSTNMVAWS